MSATLHILRGPDRCKETDAVPETKWCFRCRAHLAHRLVMLYDSEPSYYEPIFQWRCPKCGRDRTGFGET